jgi:hypothetical protein
MNRRMPLVLLILLTLACAVPTVAPAGPATRTPSDVPARPTATTTTEPLPRPPEYVVCGGDAIVVLLVDPALVSGIRTGLNTFESDVCLDGYGVIERQADFASPPEIRSYLANLYAQTGGTLAGAILIGDIPHAYQQVVLTYSNPSIPPLVEEVISFQYYADLDGDFRASPGYVSPGSHEYSFDLHEGDLDWEIWISALPGYEGDRNRTIEAVNRYLEKNHAYRSGAYDIPQGYLEINEHYRPVSAAEDTLFLNGMASGDYAWTPLSSAPDAHLYIDSFSGAVTTDQGYTALAAGVADIAVLAAHGYYLASGKIDTAWVDRNGIRAVLLWSDGCAVGDLDHPDNFLTTALYSPASQVLIAKGTTNDSGGLGTNSSGFYGHNIAAGIALGMSLGQAVLSHVNTPLIAPWSDAREFHYASVILLGDPTLRLRP